VRAALIGFSRVACDRASLLARVRLDRPERLDEFCLAGAVAAADALAAAGFEATALEAMRHVLVLGTATGSAAADAEFDRQIQTGFALASPRRFAYTLPNLVLGEIAIALGLTGENWVFAAGGASGLTALGEAARAIDAGEVDVALVLALDVPGAAFSGRPCAAAFVLEGPARAAPAIAEIRAFSCDFAEPVADADPTSLGCAGVDALVDWLGGREPLDREFAVRDAAGYGARLRCRARR
jgi:hypothetical protein